MTVLYTKDANILTIFLGGEVAETVEHRPGLFLDLDAAGKVVGVESHDAAAFLKEAQGDDGLELPEKLERSEKPHTEPRGAYA